MPKLSEIMTRDVFTVTSDMPVTEAAKHMMKGRVGSACVLQGGWLAGIFTERDALRAAASGADLTKSPIAEWMTTDPVTVSPGVDSEEAAETMLSNGFRHLPVTEGRNLVGIVSLRDLLATRIRRRPL